MKKILFTLGLISLSFTLIAQQTKYFKDEYLLQEIDEKKAKFKLVETMNQDTLLVQTFEIKGAKLLREAKTFQGKAVGTWKTFDYNGNLLSEKKFGSLVYSKTPIEGLLENNPNGLVCGNCKIAQFPGGESGLNAYLASQIKYPKESRQAGSVGTVFIRFVIHPDGKVSPHSIYRGVDPFIDLETWNLIEKMPNWEPAQEDGKSVASFSVLPVRYAGM
ncbi:energy transducer TonB [Pararhodonellum marinum]|uniref:energy transducer TonB n=1 Tax=Pararhodonellum marinum TaxID=2755358 RepID=UPI001890A8D2|nr:energy transducer TonB [Pararhodonellum marinum]